MTTHTIAIALLLTTVAYGQEVLLFDDFDQETPGVNYTSFLNWSVEQGSADVEVSDDGTGLHANLGGSSGAPAKLKSRPGYTLTGQIRLSFRISNGSPANSDTLLVELGSYNDAIFRSGVTGWEEIERDIFLDAESLAFLSFASTSTTNTGMLLDDVRLAIVPEPAVAGMTVFGLLALKRRR